jgi:hypothetical protein
MSAVSPREGIDDKRKLLRAASMISVRPSRQPNDFNDGDIHLISQPSFFDQLWLQAVQNDPSLNNTEVAKKPEKPEAVKPRLEPIIEKPKIDKERIIFNVRGVKFDVLVRNLNNVPNGRLNIIKHVIEANRNFPNKTIDIEKLDDVCDDYTKDLKEFYFNKNPVVFENILKFYQQPVLQKKTHINIQDVCPLELEEEFHYWNIDWEEYLDECCSVKLDDLRDNLHDEIKETKEIIESVTKRINFGNGCMANLRQSAWYVMEVPKVCSLHFSISCFNSLSRNFICYRVHFGPGFTSSFRHL